MGKFSDYNPIEATAITCGRQYSYKLLPISVQQGRQVENTGSPVEGWNNHKLCFQLFEINYMNYSEMVGKNIRKA